MKMQWLWLFAVHLCCKAERQYFFYSNQSSWDQAHLHCQTCYCDLVSLTADNIPLLVQNLSSDYWIGLRGNSSASKVWTQWSNGDPLVFQNWYPGRPVIPKPSVNKTQIPVPTLTPTQTPTVIPISPFTYLPEYCQIQIEELCRNYTNVTRSNNTYKNSSVDIPVELLEPVLSNPCVSLLNFGMWWERNCSELLPYVCYEDRFYGTVNVSNVTLSTADLLWTRGPGPISFYSVKIQGNNNGYNATSLSISLSNLTSGMFYGVQVFPVKCERDLNPMNTSFYTKPDCIRNLSVQAVTINSITLQWLPPQGGHSSYSVELFNSTYSTQTESYQANNLTSGTFYYFRVNAEVADQSVKGDKVSISNCTKPDIVNDLKVISITNETITVQWHEPLGNRTGFFVKLNDVDYQNVSSTNTTLNSLSPGTNYSVTVLAWLTGCPWLGIPVTVLAFTLPSPVNNLTLIPTNSSLTATWTLTNWTTQYFFLALYQGIMQIQNFTSSTNNYTFNQLMAAQNYSLSVYTCVGPPKLCSAPQNNSVFTLPVAPGSISVSFVDNSSVALWWQVPDELGPTTQYLVKCNNNFWNYETNQTVSNNTTYFSGLHSGTNYSFSVQTMADSLLSSPVSIYSSTKPTETRMMVMFQCSSQTSLLCSNASVFGTITNKVVQTFIYKFKQDVFWKMTWRNVSSPNQ